MKHSFFGGGRGAWDGTHLYFRFVLYGLLLSVLDSCIFIIDVFCRVVYEFNIHGVVVSDIGVMCAAVIGYSSLECFVVCVDVIMVTTLC